MKERHIFCIFWFGISFEQLLILNFVLVCSMRRTCASSGVHNIRPKNCFDHDIIYIIDIFLHFLPRFYIAEEVVGWGRLKEGLGMETPQWWPTLF